MAQPWATRGVAKAGAVIPSCKPAGARAETVYFSLVYRDGGE